MEISETAVGQKKLPAILLVEDEDDLRSAVAASLKKAGYEVSEASDGSVALEILKLEPDKRYLLVTDVNMTHVNGDVLIAEAMKMGVKFVSIIVSTGQGYVGMGIAKLLAEGRAKLLQKPFSASALMEMIDSLAEG